MEEKVMKGKRGGYRNRDLLKKLAKEYKDALGKVREIFELIASGAYAEKGNKSIKVNAPSFVDIVLIPVLAKLAEMLPEYDVEVPLKGQVEPDDKGYFHLRVGGRIVAGVNFGGIDSHFIKVTLFPSNRPWGNPIMVGSMADLHSIVKMVIHITGIPKTRTHDTE